MQIPFHGKWILLRVMMNTSPGGMRTIAFVSNNCWSLYNFRKQLLNHFLNLGHRVIAIAAEDEYTREIREMGCVFYAVNFRNSAVSPLRDINVFFSLRKIYQQEKPGFIFHYVTKPCIYGSFAAGQLDIPSIAVITGLGYVFSGDKWIRRPVQLLFRSALVHAKEVWFLNAENARFFEENAIIKKSKSRILPGEGIDTQWFSPAKNKPHSSPFVFLMVSRLLWSKGLGTYMEAARILRNNGIHADFRLLGKPEKGHPESVPTEQLTLWEKQGLLTNLGFRDDVRTALGEANCLVLPTYYEEGIPRTLLEACSMEIPCITSDRTGSHSVIEDRINGLLCQAKNAGDLAEKMITMINIGDTDRIEMGKRGRQKMVKQFDLSAVISIYEQTINHYL